MRVLFSNPPWWAGLRAITGANGQPYQVHIGGVRAGSRWPHTDPVYSRPDHFVFGSYLPYPFFMGYAATYVAAKTGASVVLRDSIALAESYESYFRYLDENPFDYIFIESATPSWDHDGQLLRLLNRRYPHTKIVLTGPITIDAAQLMTDFPIHACIRGEYEKGSVKVIQGTDGIIDFDLLTKEEMNAAPFPYFDSTCAHRYWDANPVGQVAPHAQVWSSRGCPYKCIFCVWPATMTGNDPDGTRTRTVRHYAPDYMEAFLREIVARYNYKTIYFDDDTFNLGNAHVERMCGVMSKIGLPWSAMCRADSIKMENWRLMKESGCFGVKLGFESGNQYVVDKIVNKRLNLDEAREVVFNLKRLGMTVHGTFTIGLPGETPEQMDDTKRFITSLPFDSYQLSGCAEIEGTPLHSLSERGELEKYEGAKLDDNYFRHSDGTSKYAAMSAVSTSPKPRQPRHFVYCDASLINNKGHYANSCRHITSEATRRSVDTVVLSSLHIEPNLKQELNARPHFSLPGWATTSSDPLCGWMESFFTVSESTFNDINRVQGLEACDTLYWNSSQAAELKAIIDWMQARFTPENCPRVVVEFGYFPGVVTTTDAAGARSLNTINQQPYLYRFAMRRLKPEYRQKLVLGTFDPASSRDYSDMLGTEVVTFPLPQRFQSSARLRSSDKRTIVSFIGHQRPDKGFHFVPDLVRQLLRDHADLRIFVHNGAETEMVEQTRALQGISQNEPRLGVHHGAADGQLWDSILDASSLIVLPYQPERYTNAYSAILAEALARGIPMVVPAGTTMAHMIHQYGECGTTFQGWTPQSILAAIHQALANFPQLAQNSLRAAQLWREHHGPEKTLDAIFGTAVNPAKTNNSVQTHRNERKQSGFVALDTLLRSSGSSLLSKNDNVKETPETAGINTN